MSTLYLDTSEPIHGKNTYFFGKFNEAAVHFSYSEFPIFIVFGIFGGLVGALFVNVNYRLSVLRMKLVFVVIMLLGLTNLTHKSFRHITSNRKKLLESVFVAVLVAIVSLTSIGMLNYCHPKIGMNSPYAVQVRNTLNVIITITNT